MSETLMTAEQRAREFAIGAFAPFGVKSIEPYVEIIAELSRGAEQDERKRIADVIDEAATDSATKPDADPDRIDVLRGVASVLRIPNEELLLMGLTQMVDEIRAEQTNARHNM